MPVYIVINKYKLIDAYNIIYVQGLEDAPGYAAYACQCKWKALNEASASEAENMSWMCSGH